jgi:hypothetical protein
MCGSVTSSVATLTVYLCRLINSNEDSTSAGNASLNIYPNPNDGSFTLDVQLPDDGNVNIEAYNMLGEMVLSENHGMKKGDNKFNMQIRNGCCGLYMIIVKTYKETFYRKMVVE